MNTYRPLFKLFVLLIVCQMALSGCIGANESFSPAVSYGMLNQVAEAGGVDALQPKSTIWGIEQCLKAARWTEIYSDGNQKFLFLWRLGTRYDAFFGIDVAAKSSFDLQDDILAGGQVAGYKSIKDLTATIQSNGWQKVAPEVVPPELKNALGQVASWLSATMRVRLPVILLVLPTGGMDSISPCSLPEYDYLDICTGGISQ